MKKFDSKSCEEIMTTVYKPIEFVVDNLIGQGLYSNRPKTSHPIQTSPNRLK